MPEVKWVFMVVVIGALYWSKKDTKKTSKAGPNNLDKGLQYKGGAAIRSKFFTDDPSDGKPKKGGIHNALTPVARSVPSQRLLKKMTNQGQMIATFSEADKGRIMRGGMNDKQMVDMAARNGWYAEGMHPDSTKFHANGTKI